MYESQAYNELPLGPTSSIVAPSHIPGLPPVAPHHPLVIRLPELAELAHKVVDVDRFVAVCLDLTERIYAV